jgi:sterol desaturase/sphingolipid hydroxylase (fatty acid hydroxylase superfamily)
MSAIFANLSGLVSIKVWLVQMIAFHGFGLWFEWLDRTGRARAYKFREPERRNYLSLAPRVLANQTFVLLPSMVMMERFGLAYVGPSSLSPFGWAVSFVGLTIGHDVVQYVAHRAILHQPKYMRSLGHLLHHTTAGSRGISACYMSAADFFLEIVCPYLVPLALVGGGGSGLLFHSVVVTGGAFGGLYEHSGYDFGRRLRGAGGWRATLGRLLSSEAHAAHHARGNVSFSDGFGSSNICDTLLRTRWDLAPDPRYAGLATGDIPGDSARDS